jgi:hypothetical protein
MTEKRDYDKEYKEYHGTPEHKKNRGNQPARSGKDD